jgi:thioredoxin-related protein
MSSCSRWLAILLVPTVLVAVRANADIQWFRDLDEAKAVAGRQKKDLLINFTGSSWCGACIDLKHDVLEQPVFDSAAESFVLVELEFPQSFADLPDEFREKYLAWRDHYGICSYPTVLLADQEGRVYAVTGHIGVGAEEYIAHLKKLQRNRESFKAALAKATNAEGLTKARRLDDALSIFRRSCVKGLDESNGNPLIRFYRPEIEEIIALDVENEAGLREKYQGILAAEQEKDRVRGIYNQLRAVQAKEGFAAAIESLDTIISKEKSPRVRNRLKRSRITYLE